MKILIDENIPYVEHFFHDYLDDIEYFKDKEFEINMVKEEKFRGGNLKIFHGLIHDDKT